MGAFGWASFANLAAALKGKLGKDVTHKLKVLHVAVFECPMAVDISLWYLSAHNCPVKLLRLCVFAC